MDQAGPVRLYGPGAGCNGSVTAARVPKRRSLRRRIHGRRRAGSTPGRRV